MKYNFEQLKSQIAKDVFAELMMQYVGKHDPLEISIDFKVNGQDANFMEFIEKFDKGLDEEVLSEANRVVVESYSDLFDKSHMLLQMVSEQMTSVSNSEVGFLKNIEWVFENNGSFLILPPEETVSDERIKYQIDLTLFFDDNPIVVSGHYMTLISGIEAVVNKAKEEYEARNV